ncbi:Bacterial ABC transporter protein EcsB [Jeotgalicoccus saudimassiliensis]|uniref:Bacterial ABC transporter protein EcsB n=1 Tax=Jeotgalicoccus saudimassiliensis TaxID=1461582 RepID=A0A078M4C0_9STAP|nr:ABC transporter permease [Jeotgalicoccus saudimassiliensis]CEA01089.1 Bacterial ABC transporter protein EcsB [Jeotgalicoccus saudimassiliensis]
MSSKLFNTRMEEDVKIRSYYGKYIFNSHFLVFMMIAGGVLLYTLLGLRETLSPSVYIDALCALLMAAVLLPKYRTLLKEADMLFLPPYEKKMTAYFKRADIYSLSLGLALPATAAVAVLILLSIGHGLTPIVIFFLLAVLLYFSAFNIRRLSVNTEFNKWTVTAALIVINFVSLMLVLINPALLVAGLLFIIIFTVVMKNNSFKTLSWLNYVQYEKEALQQYYQTVSMFTNVKRIDKAFKRRRILDVLLWEPKSDKFNKKYMYEYLFYRSFMRDHDLPMIVLRIIVLFFIIMFWIGNLYVSLIFSLFGIYLIVLQMSQIYTAQAYLLWPKVWPVSRTYIQDSYIRYSHKIVFVITLLFAVMFIVTHPAQFIYALAFPLWGYMLNRVLSKSIYKKERELSD